MADLPSSPQISAPSRPVLQVLVVVSVLLWAGGRTAQGQPPDASPAPGAEEPQGEPGENPSASEDPTLTAGGALQKFMASRDYRTIKRLKDVMTERLQTRFDHDSAPFNGKRGNRLAAFDFSEKDLKPARPPAKAPARPASYQATVRSLWEEQGEATERRTESVSIVQQDSGLWRIAGLTVVSSDKLRFSEAVNGVTVLRMVLRAWHHGDPSTARASLSAAFLAKRKGKDEALGGMFTPAEGRRHAAYQIEKLTPQGTTAAVAQVRLYETVVGEPGPILGQPHTLKMVRKGSRWLVDAWD